MFHRGVLRAGLAASLATALAFPAATPVAAQSDLERQLLGLGAAVIIDQINRSQQQQPRQQQTNRPQQPTAQGASRQQQAAPRIDPARQAAMDLQRDLNALGFDAGPVDGLPGRRTRAAVEAFQISRGFAPTGSLTAMQRLALETDMRRQASGGVETAEVRRAEILETQSYLATLGYDPGTPDGAWGPRSQAALDAFRRDAGMQAAGAGLRPADNAALYARVHGVGPVGRSDSTRMASAQAMTQPATGAAQPPRPSFDCARAGTPTERAICASPQLAAYDRQLAAAWSAATAGGGTAALLPRQQQWLAQRNACGAETACLEAMMGQRITELTGAPPAPVAPAGFPAGVPGGGFAVASFGQDGLTVPSAGRADFAAGAADAASPAGAADWLHLEGNQFRSSFMGDAEHVQRILTLSAIKLDPATIADDNTLRQSLIRDRAARTGRDIREVRTEIGNLNPLDLQDALAAHRAELLAEAQATPDLTPETAIPIAIYRDVTAGVRRLGLQYVEGQGIRLLEDAALGTTLPGVNGFRGQFTISAILPGTDILPLSRDEASAFLNAHQARQAGRERLVQVVWGRLTRLGIDESMNAFAAPNVTGSVYGAAKPATFVPERVTLHYTGAQRETRLVTPATPVVHEWRIGPGAPGDTGGGRDALALARELGLPIEDGHVLAGQGAEQAWQTFRNLAWVGANPDAARQGDAFAEIAASLLPEVDRRAFFGERQTGTRDLATSLDLENPDRGRGYAANYFADEFMRQDAKAAFLDRYYDAILARTPTWPLPLLHKVPVTLGEYDFATQSFPIRGLAEAQFRVAGTGHVQVSERYRRDGLYSVDRFGGLPARLPMPPDQARGLRDVMRERGNTQLVLAWWADLDWGEDATLLENAIAPRRPVGSREPRPGRGTLKRVALFLDQGLSQPLMEIDPAAVLRPLPQIETPDTQVSATLAQIAEVERASGPRLLASVARALGDGPEIWDRLARTQNAVLEANEFDAPAAVAEAIAALQAEPDGPIWLEGTATLGEYDLDAGRFAFTEGSGYVRFRIAGDTGKTRIQPTLVGADPFGTLAVDRDVAREIVEAAEPGRRGVSFLLRARPMSAVDRSHPRQADTAPAFDLVLQPEQVIFWRTDDRNEPADVLATLSYDEANAAREERLSRRFEPGAFEALATVRPVLDPHVLDLLLVRQAGGTMRQDWLQPMLLAAWEHERGGGTLPGPRFFAGDADRPTGPSATLLEPSFASYMAAKAAALGDGFALDMTLASAQPACGEAMEAGPIYGNRIAIMEALPQLADDASRLRQRLREESGAFEVERRYGLIQRRPSVRNPGNCDQWFAVARIADAVHQGSAPTGEAAAVRVEFTLDAVQPFAGSFAVPDVLVTGRAAATRLVAEDGTLGPPIEAAEPEPDPQPEAAGTQVAALASSAATAPGAARPQAPQEAADDAAWPDLAGTEIAPAGIDVLGLRTGQSMDEADTLIRERGGVLAAYEVRDARLGERSSPALAYRRVYITRDGTEALSLGSYAPDGPVISLMRRMVLSDGRLPYDRIDAGLMEKYGPPDTEGAEMGMPGVRAWLGGATGPEAAVCAAFPSSSVSLRQWQRLDGVGEAGWQPDQRGRTAWQFGLPDYPADLLAYTGACGVVLAYREEDGQQWGASGFSLLMIDFEAIRTVEAALQDSVGTADLEIEF